MSIEDEQRRRLEAIKHPLLRRVAETAERSGFQAEVLDEKWRVVYTTTVILEAFPLTALESENYFGLSYIARVARLPEHFGVDKESNALFVEQIVPQMIHDVPPPDPDYAEIFDRAADLFRAVEPTIPPLTTTINLTYRGSEYSRKPGTSPEMSWFLHRIIDSDGSFIGQLAFYQRGISQALASRLLRGEAAAHELMDSLREPQRRPAAILFVDLEASGPLSRSMSSVSYFGLIRSLRDLVDEAVGSRSGIVGKHAGDGASALFVPLEYGPAAESQAARSAIEAARAIRDAMATLESDELEVRVNIGLHWGATLTIGQISSTGRLEVTAIGDEMNECARIEAAAKDGALLVAKDLVERLAPEDAAEIGVEAVSLRYRTLDDLAQDAKVSRDAGQIAVANL